MFGKICETAKASQILAVIRVYLFFPKKYEALVDKNGVSAFLSLLFTMKFVFQLGAADYVSIAQNYHTVFVTDIPVMSMRNSDQVWIILSHESLYHDIR